MNILARIRSYDELAAALKTERRRQGVSQTKLEQLLGWDWEYLWKLESKRKYPAGRLTDWLRGLGVELVLVKTADFATGKLSEHPSDPTVYQQVRKKAAEKGARARKWNISRARKREIARLGGLARWKKGRGK